FAGGRARRAHIARVRHRARHDRGDRADLPVALPQARAIRKAEVRSQKSEIGSELTDLVLFGLPTSDFRFQTSDFRLSHPNTASPIRPIAPTTTRHHTNRLKVCCDT